MAFQRHRCKAAQMSSIQSILPPLARDANCLQRFWYKLRKSTLITEENPRCGHFYRSTNEVMFLRQEQINSKSSVIHPLSMFRLYYEFYMAFVFLLCLVYMPFDAAFDRHVAQDTDFYYRGFSLSASILSFIDIFLRFNTGIADEREKVVVMDRKTIIKAYLLSIHFYSDVLSSLPDASIYTSNVALARCFDCLAMLKIFRIKTMFDYFTRMVKYLNVHNGYYDAFRLLALLFLVMHYVACLCYIGPSMKKAITGKYDRRSWIVMKRVWPELPHYDKYVICSYRAGGFLLGISFESQSRQYAWEEAILMCIFYTFGRVFMYVLVVIIVQRLLIIRAFETKYYEVVEEVKGFINRHHLMPSIMEKLLMFYGYKYHKTYFRDRQITSLLSESLKKEVNAVALSGLSETVAMFTELSEEIVFEILSHLHAEIYLPQDVIIKAGEVGDCMYFIASGTVAVLTPSGKEVCHLYDGAYFGEICLVLKEQTTRTANVIALEICEVYKLSKRSFHICFKDLKEMKKRMEAQSIARREMTQAYEDLFMGAFTAAY